MDLIFTNLTSSPKTGTYDSKDDTLSSQSMMFKSELGRTQMSMMTSTMMKSTLGGGQENQSHSKAFMDFEHFIKFMEQIAEKVFPSLPISQAFVYLLADFILPLLQELSETRCVQNKQILDLIGKLESEDLIEFLTVLHKAIIRYFLQYADQRGMVDFETYLKFCTEFCIFPDLVSKPMLYRIFHTLSDINELHLPGNANQSVMMS